MTLRRPGQDGAGPSPRGERPGGHPGARPAAGTARPPWWWLSCALALSCSLGLGLPGAARAQQRSVFPSADGPGAEPVMLRGLIWRSTAVVGGALPAVVLLPDCHGAWRDEAGDTPEGSIQELALALNEAGLHVMVLDSLRPRGLREICSDKIAARQLRPGQLRRDALAALGFLGQQTGVDPQRLGLVGLGRGALTVLAAVNRQHADVRRAPRAVAAVAIRPACTAELRSGYETGAALAVLLADTDEADSNAHCRDLVQQLAAGGAAAAHALLVSPKGPRPEVAAAFLREQLRGPAAPPAAGHAAASGTPAAAHKGASGH